MTTSPSIAFRDGRSIPQLGYGVWQVENAVAAEVVVRALEAGYRHVDTARGYNNEAGVGQALKASGLARDEVFVTSKVPNQDQGRDKTLASFDATMEDLGLEELDLYLIHWPAPSKGLELHPYLHQSELRQFHAGKGIVTQSWSPLGQGGGELEDLVITQISEAHGATPAQVLIAWNLALGNVVIPKSVTPERIDSNFASLELTLTEDEIAQINALDKGAGARRGPNPDEFAGHQGA